MTHAAEREIVATGVPKVDVEDELVLPSGRCAWMTWSKLPLPDERGRPVGTITIARDITERKRAEDALRGQTERLARVIDTQRELAAAEVDLHTVMQLICLRT